MKALILTGFAAMLPVLVSAADAASSSATVLSGIPTVYFALGAIVLLAALYMLLGNKQRKDAPPRVPYKVPYFGNAVEMADPVEFLKKAHEKYGDVITVHMFGRDIIFVNSAETRKIFFETPEEVLCARKAYAFTIPVFGKGVVYDSPHEEFQQQRKFCSTGLSTKRFKLYTDIIREEVVKYCEEKLGDSGTIDLFEALNTITLYTSTRCLQGKEVHSRFNKDFAELFNNLDAALSMVSFFWPNAPIPLHFRRDKARQAIKKLYKEIIAHRRAHPEEEHEDLLQTLLESRYSDGSQCTDDEMVGLCTGVLLAGQHTSNVTSTWLALFMLSNPDIYAKIMAEHDEICPPDEPFAPFTYEKLMKMEFLNACMKETLRLRPPIIMVFRYAEQDFKMKDYVVPKGTLVSVSPALANRSPEAFTNPDTFDPDRFSKERQEDKKVAHTYIPFSSGRHACMGETFAYLQVKAIWATLLHYYEFEIMPHSMKADYTTMIAGPVKPVTVKYKRRANVKLH